MMDAIRRKDLFDLFEKLNDVMTVPQRICVIGAAAVLCHGSTDRQTGDIDVWRPASDINDRALADAVRQVGIGYNPDSIETDGLYLQVIRPGVVQLPAFDGKLWSTGEAPEVLWQGKALTVTSPPVSIVIAAKLARAEDKDIDDSVYLIGARNVTQRQVSNAISAIMDPSIREAARENLVLLQVVLQRSQRKLPGKEGPQTERGEGWEEA